MTAKVKRTSGVMPPKGQTVLRKETFMERYGVWIYLFLAFFIPFILMYLAFKAAGVSPYGTNQVLVTDSWHQYYPFLTDFQDKLKNGGSLLWTWKSGGGTNYVALMSYYLSSPLNFFSVLVPADKLKEFFFVITCVKIGLSGFFYALFLKITFKRKDPSITAFGILYALCAFMMGYYWNIMWLDTVALLPLVIAGTFALLREGKFRLYVIALGLSILANYYIGLFTCVFVFLVSVGYCITEYKGWRGLIRQFLKMAGCSLLGIMMSAVLTLPAYFALGYTHSSDNTFPAQFAVNIGSTADLGGVLEAMGKTIANSIAFIEPTAKEGLPNIYCGVITIFFALLFLFCSKIKKRERIFCGGLLVFFMLSFIVRQLDYLWHGMHFPNMLPYRFSFLYSFVLLYMAFRVFMNIDEIKLVSVIGAILAFAIYLGVASTFFDGETVKLSPIFGNASDADPVVLSGVIGIILAAWILLYALRDRIPLIATVIGVAVIGLSAAIFVLTSGPLINSAVNQTAENSFYIFVAVVIVLLTAAAALLIGSKEANRSHQMTKVVLSVLVLVLALVEGLFSAASGVKAVGVTDATTYPLGTSDTLACVDYIKTAEEGNAPDLYHTEVNKYHTLNDNALIGVNGISMFNSMVRKDVTAFMEKFGICGWVASNRYTYQEGSPFTNMMLNVKYLIAPYGAYLDTIHNQQIYQSGNVKLMENQYYLPQGFVVGDSVLDFDPETAPLNPMENQNDLFRKATGLTGDIYEYLEGSPSAGETEGGSIQSTSFGNYSYSAGVGNGSFDISYTVPRDGTATAYFSAATDNISIRVNGAEKIGYYIKRPFIMMVGDVKQGDVITLHSTMSNSTTGTINAYCAMFNDALFTQGYSKLSQSALRATEVTDTKIAGEIDSAQDGLFYTSISYAKGWRAYVDGVEADITPVGGALLAFRIPQGHHTVELRYMPEGFVVGLSCTVLAIFIFIALCVVIPRRKKLFPQLCERFEAKAEEAQTAVTEDAVTEADVTEINALEDTAVEGAKETVSEEDQAE